MKNTHLFLTLLGLSVTPLSHVFAQNHQVEAIYGEDDTGSQTVETTGFAYQYFFSGLADSGPLRESEFLSQSSRLSVGFVRASVSDVEANAFAFGGSAFLGSSGFYIEGLITETAFEQELDTFVYEGTLEIDTTEVELSLGYYFNDSTAIQFSVSEAEEEGSFDGDSLGTIDSSSYGIDFKTVFNVATNQWIGIDAGYSIQEEDGFDDIETIDAEVMYYPKNSIAVGLFVDSSSDDHDTVTTSGIRANYFFTSSVFLELEYSETDSDDFETEDGAFMIGLGARF